MVKLYYGIYQEHHCLYLLQEKIKNLNKKKVFTFLIKSFSSKKLDEIQEILPKLTSALQDPSSVLASNTNEVLRKLVPSHKNPVLCIKWLPSTIEIDRKVFYNLITNTSIYNFIKLYI